MGGIGRFALVAAVITGLVTGTASHAETLLIGQVDAPPELRKTADSLRILLATKNREPGPGTVVSRLSAELTPKTSKSGLLGKSRADYGIYGRLEANGPDVWFSATVIGKDGTTRKIRVEANRANISSLAVKAAREVSSISGSRPPKQQEAGLGELYPFASALRRREEADPKGAAHVILAGSRRIARSVPGATHLVDDLLSDERVPTSAKLSIASSFDLFERAPPLIEPLPKKEKKLWTRVFAARREMARMRNKEAVSTVSRSSWKSSPDATLTLAQAAHRAKDKRALAKAFRVMARSEVTHPPTLRWLAGLPANEVPPRLTKRLNEQSEALRTDYPVLANRLNLRAAAGARKEAIGDVDAFLLADREAKEAERLLLAMGDRTAAQNRVYVDLALRAGQSDKALERVTLALESAPTDEGLLARKAALKAKGTGATSQQLDLADGSESSEPGAKKIDIAAQTVADELMPLLESFPELASLRSVAVASLSEDFGAFYAPRWLDQSRFEEGLQMALMRAPYRLAASSTSPMTEEMTAASLQQFVSSHGVEGALLYELGAKGNKARVKLVLYRAGEAVAVEQTIAGARTGLVLWNPWYLRMGIALGALTILWLGLVLLRGSGSVSVRIKMNAASKEYLSVKLSRSPQPPQIPDLEAYAKTLKAQGLKSQRLSATHIGKSIEFPSVPTGRYYVHLYGVVEDGTELRPLAETSEIRVSRRDTAHTVFDLVPKKVEYRLRITGEGGPLGNAQVWVDGEDEPSMTDAEGRTIVWAPTGSHALKVLHDGDEIQVDVHAANTKRQDVGIHFDREKRLARLAEGIVLEDSEVEAPAEIKRSEPPAPMKKGAVSFKKTKAMNPSAGAQVSGVGATKALQEGPPSVSIGNPSGSLTGLSRYRPEKELGSGAMGVVMLATDQVLDRTVALKVMSQAVQEHPAAAKMFMQEAKALAALNHQNIVTVFDQGSDNGQMFIVMEYVEGTTLEARMEEAGKLPLLEAIMVTAQLADALAYAHERRVIHRDIKPANIFLDKRNRVKLGDFGIARVMKEAMIRQTEIKGTPLYMSPEQITGKDIDARSDLYAVGCTFYEMLTGRPPFVEGEVLFHHMHTEPEPPSSHEPSIPANVDAVVMSCLMKDKAQRPASAAALEKDLRSLLP